MIKFDFLSVNSVRDTETDLLFYYLFSATDAIS